MIRQLDYIVIYLLFQYSFQVDLFDYVCDLLTGLVLRFTFCPSITFELDLRGHGGRVVTLSPPTSAAGVRSPSWP